MRLTILRIIVLPALITAAAVGQTASINAELTGNVLDPSGAPIANATVRAANAGTGYQQVTTTTSSGLYRLPVLPLGRYSLTVEVPGFARYEQSGIALSAGSTATVDVKLQLKGVTTEVIVSSSAPIVDSARTDQGSTLSSNAVLNLPLVSRNPFNFILQQPNVSGRANTEFGVPRKLNANGFNGRINYQLDGSNNVQSDRAGIRLLPISQTWIQEVQAVNNGFAPEFGNTVGTLFNTITRSGTNELHGEAAYLFRRTPMSARPALLPENQPTPDVNVDSVFADAGGRLVKDRAFFFGGYEHVKRDLPAPVTVAPSTLTQLGLPANFANAIPFSQNVTFFIGKVDWQLNSNHRLSLRYNGHRNDSPYNSSIIGGQFLMDRTYKFVDRSHGGAVQLVSVFSPNAVNELRFQVPFRSQSQARFEATGSGPAISIPGVANFGNSLDVGFRFEETTPEVNENFSYNLAKHGLKFGGSVRAIRDTQVQATAALYTFPNVAAYLAAKDGLNTRTYASFIQTVGEPSMEYNSLFSGLYAQDTWKPRANITVTYGVRYDVYRPPQCKRKLALRVFSEVSDGQEQYRATAGRRNRPWQNGHKGKRRRLLRSVPDRSLPPSPPQQWNAGLLCDQRDSAVAVRAGVSHRLLRSAAGLPLDSPGHHECQPRFLKPILRECERVDYPGDYQRPSAHGHISVHARQPLASDSEYQPCTVRTTTSRRPANFRFRARVPGLWKHPRRRVGWAIRLQRPQSYSDQTLLAGLRDVRDLHMVPCDR